MDSNRTRFVDTITVGLLLVGLPLLVIGELIGMVLLWSSKTWSNRDKIIGTLIPIEIIAAVLLLSLGIEGRSCSSSIPCTNPVPSTEDILLIAMLVATLIVAFGSAIKLVRRVYQRTP